MLAFIIFHVTDLVPKKAIRDPFKQLIVIMSNVKELQDSSSCKTRAMVRVMQATRTKKCLKNSFQWVSAGVAALTGLSSALSLSFTAPTLDYLLDPERTHLSGGVLEKGQEAATCK